MLEFTYIDIKNLSSYFSRTPYDYIIIFIKTISQFRAIHSNRSRFWWHHFYQYDKIFLILFWFQIYFQKKDCYLLNITQQ
ncbi:hypothetical protein pb186bvf_002581 [Paramecium bursaria]